MKKKLTLKEQQEKYLPLYIAQPKPESINLNKGCLALKNCIEVLVYPYLHHQTK